VKVLMVRLSAIGDVVHTLPALAALRGTGAEVDWLVEPGALPLLEGNPAVREVVPAPPARRFGLVSAARARRRLRGRGYDVALDLQGLWKSAAWARQSGAGRVAGFDGPWRREPLSRVLLTERAALTPEPAHVIDKNLSLLRVLGVDAVGRREFPLPPTDAQRSSVDVRLQQAGLQEFAVLNPGGGWASKLWPPESFGALARGMRARGLPSLVTWGPGEEALADRVVAASDATAIRCFPTTLLELVELMRRARIVVAADTGPIHLACAIGTPVVGIYGPTDPARNGPFAASDMTVRRRPLCAPCHRRRCAIHDGVMAAIAPAEVLAAVDRRLSGHPASPASAV
jgi:lipopolysaccharide heptosyltransferase I